MLAHLLNKAIDFECFLIDKGGYYVYPYDSVIVIDADGDVIVKEVE